MKFVIACCKTHMHIHNLWSTWYFSSLQFFRLILILQSFRLIRIPENINKNNDKISPWETNGNAYVFIWMRPIA